MFGRRSVEYHNGTTVESLVETHECTEKDWKKFYPIDEKSKTIFDEINDDEERSFTCVDWSQMDIDIFTQGTGEIKNSRLDFIWVPCNMLYPALGITYETINDSCIDDLQQQKDYLQSMKVLMMVNDARFDQSKFEDDSIVKYSRILHKQVDQNNPQWIHFDLQMRQLSDQSQYF